MASYNENTEFRDHLIPRDLLDDAISWIKKNLKPSEVFDRDQLKDYAEDEFLPGELFNEEQLADWAESNGFTKEG